MRFALLLFVAYASSAAGQAKPAATRAANLDSLSATLTRLDRDKKFSGVVLIADAGKVVHHSAHGYAHKGYQVPNRPDTKFNLASVGKTFTAVAIGQLVAQGKLKFTDTLGRVLPDYPNKSVANRVTIAQLLSHRSGLGLYWDSLFAGNWTAVRTTKDLLPFFVNDTLLFAPGTSWYYSNTGFAVLAMVVEKLSGEDYFGYIKRHIYQPVGMTDTDYYELDQDVPNLAIGYYRDEHDVLKNNLFTHTVRGGGAGGGFSTAPDLLKWAEALRTGKVLGLPLIGQMMSKQTADDHGGAYGYGFIVDEREGKTLVGHTGGFAGIATFFFMDPERDRVGILMCNEPGDELREVWRWVGGYLRSAT